MDKKTAAQKSGSQTRKHRSTIPSQRERILAVLQSGRNTHARAREQQADLYADEIIKIADDCTPTHEEIAKARVRIDARKWKAARLAPKKYGEKSELDMKSSDGSMTPKAGQVQMTKEDLQGALSEALKEITR